MADVRAVYCCGSPCASKPPFVSPQGTDQVPGSRSSACKCASDIALNIDNSTPPTGRNPDWQSTSTTRVCLRVHEGQRSSTTSRDEVDPSQQILNLGVHEATIGLHQKVEEDILLVAREYRADVARRSPGRVPNKTKGHKDSVGSLV